MPIKDKVAAARKISELLNGIIQHGDFRLKYKIMVDPPAVDPARFRESASILVDLSGADSPLVLERGAELLRAFEQVALEMLRLSTEEHDLVVFDCQNFRTTRKKELRMAAKLPPSKCAAPGFLTPLLPCLRASVVWCTLRCAIIPTCAPRAPAKRCNATSSSIPRITAAKPPAPAVSRRR